MEDDRELYLDEDSWAMPGPFLQAEAEVTVQRRAVLRIRDTVRIKFKERVGHR